MTETTVERTIDLVPRYVGRFVAVLVAVVVIGSPVATCLALASTDAEMACCVKGTHDCVPGMKTADCCEKSTAQSSQATTIANVVSLLPPSLAVIQIFSPGLPPLAAWHSHPFADGLSPPGSKHPTYLVLSTFRI